MERVSQNIIDAYNILLNWNCRSVRELLAAIEVIQASNKREYTAPLPGILNAIAVKSNCDTIVGITPGIAAKVYAVDQTGEALVGELPNLVVTSIPDLLKRSAGSIRSKLFYKVDHKSEGYETDSKNSKIGPKRVDTKKVDTKVDTKGENTPLPPTISPNTSAPTAQ